MKIKLGQKIRDIVTGMEGIATAKVEYLNGCIQYCLRPAMDKDGKLPEASYVDEGQLEVIGDGVSVEPRDTGGPQRDCPKS